LDFFLSSEVVTTQQTSDIAHKLKPRSFNKSMHLQVHIMDFHLWCELHLTSMRKGGKRKNKEEERKKKKKKREEE